MEYLQPSALHFHVSRDRRHKWRSKKKFFCFCANQTNYSLVLKELLFYILSVLTRLMRLISTKTKEYFFGRHLCIRSMLSLGKID